MIKKPRAPTHATAKAPPSSTLLGKIRRRGIIEALATFLGSGWLVYEIVHFILVDHYRLPEVLKDITIVSVLCLTLCNLVWRWFRGESRARGPRWERILIPAFILVAAAANLNMLLRGKSLASDAPSGMSAASPWKKAVAVLPFVNMSPEKDQEYFCDGLTEELITKLSHISELRVTARTSAFAFKGENRDIREVGRLLGVDAVLEGSVRKEGPRLRISAQLINVSDGFHLWSSSYDRDLEKVFVIQDDIALSVAGALKMALLDGPQPRHTPSLEAYNEFLLGRYYAANPTRENTAQAVEHFERALDLDPDYARAWSALASTLASQASFGYVPIEVGFPKAVSSIERALRLDPRLASAYSIQGYVKMTYDWDWAGAEKSYEKALSLEPGTGLLGASQLALALGRNDRALYLARLAQELDALNVTANMNLALAAFYSGQLKEAAVSFRKVLDINPDRANAHALMGQVLLAQARHGEALAEIEREKDEYWRLPALALAYHALGRKDDSDAALAAFSGEFDEVGAYQIAQVHSFRGESDQAFQWLEKAYVQRDGGLFLTKADPFFKNLKHDKRYAAFLKKMRLPSDPASNASRDSVRTPA